MICFLTETRAVIINLVTHVKAHARLYWMFVIREVHLIILMSHHMYHTTQIYKKNCGR